MKLPTLGRVELISVLGRTNVPAKVDTGADSSAIWASHIRIDEKKALKFTLFDESSPFYNGKTVSRKDYSVVRIKSSNGQTEMHYRTHFSIVIAGKRMKVLMNLANRSHNEFPVLIGRRTLNGKFVVDVRKIPLSFKESKKVSKYNGKLKKDPYSFHKTYVEKEN